MEQAKILGKRLLNGDRQVQRLQRMWLDLKDFIRASSILLLGEYYESFERAWAFFTWRMARMLQRGMVLRDRLMEHAGKQHNIALAWASDRLGLELQQAEQLLFIIYTIVLAVGIAVLVHANRRH